MSEATPAATAAPATKKKNRGLTASDIKSAFLLDGVDAVRKLIDGGKASKDTLRHVKKDLEERLKDGKFEAAQLKPLQDYYSSLHGKRITGLQPGEEKDYTAQATDGQPTPFIRVPLWAGAKKGDKVRARMAADNEPLSLWVRPVAASDAPAAAGEVDETPDA